MLPSFQALPIQQQTFQSSCQNPMTILADGRGSGRTTALFTTALMTQHRNILLVSSSAGYDAFNRFLQDTTWEYRESPASRTVSIGNKKIKFVKYSQFDHVSDFTDMLLIDDVHLCDEGILKRIRPNSQLTTVVTTMPMHCGYRSLNYVNRFDTEISESWDSHLINWKENQQIAQVSDYKDNVKILNGFGIEQNLHLGSTYCDMLSNMSPNDKLKHSGKFN